MNSPTSRSSREALSFAAAFLPLLPAGIHAQDLYVSLPTVPSGFTGVGSPTSGGVDSDVFGNLLDGFSASTSLAGTYDSNLTHNQAAPGVDDEDFILSLGTNLGYRTQGQHWTFGGNYRGSYDNYTNNTDYSGFNQDFSLLGAYTGVGRFSAIFTVGFDSNRGTNRVYEDFVERFSTNYNLSTRYQISPKTTLNGTLGYSTTSVDQDFADTASLDLGFFALWRYSPLTQFGPGIRYTLRTGDNQPDRTSIGPTLNLNYKLSSKVSLNSRFGMDFAEYEDGEKADPGFSTSVGVNYRASALWGMNLSLVRDVQADPTTAGTFREVTALRAGYNRRIRRATFNCGASLERSTSESEDDSTGTVRDYFSLDSSISMPIFKNSTRATLFTRYSDQNSDDSPSWNGYQFGFSLSRGF